MSRVAHKWGLSALLGQSLDLAALKISNSDHASDGLSLPRAVNQNKLRPSKSLDALLEKIYVSGETEGASNEYRSRSRSVSLGVWRRVHFAL